MLRTVPADHPVVPHPILVLVSPPGVGKSTLCASHTGTHFDFDRGVHRAALRRDTSVQVDDWRDVEQATAALTAGASIDTLERAIGVLKASVRKPGADDLSPRDHGIVRSRFADWLQRVRASGPVVITAHAKEERLGDTLRIRLDLSAGIAAELLKVADFVGLLRRDGQRRVLDFDPPGFQGKNSAQWSPIDVPSPDALGSFLTDLLQRGRLALEANALRSRSVAGSVDRWLAEIAAYTTVDQFNAALGRLGEVKGRGDAATYKQIRERLWAWHQRRGLTWDGGRFVVGAGGFLEGSQSSENPARVASAQPGLAWRDVQ